LTKEGLEERNPWDYANFSAIHITQLWSSKSEWMSSDVFGGRELHEIALARFAPYIGTDEVYLDYLWGRLFGRGYVIDCTDLTNIKRSEVWRS
jgi:hypothetical protein